MSGSDRRVGEDVVVMITVRSTDGAGLLLIGALLQAAGIRHIEMPAWFFISKFGYTQPSNAPNWATDGATFFKTQVNIGSEEQLTGVSGPMRPSASTAGRRAARRPSFAGSLCVERSRPPSESWRV